MQASDRTGAAKAASVVAAGAVLRDVTLVKAGDGMAVVRAGMGALQKVKAGDLVGTTKAAVKEITPGRIVLEESFTGVDGRPNRALIVIKEGERGGTRYLLRANEKKP